MNKKLREILNKRVSLDANNDFETEKCWSDETLVLSENIDDTIVFFKANVQMKNFFGFRRCFQMLPKNAKQRFCTSIKAKIGTSHTRQLCSS